MRVVLVLCMMVMVSVFATAAPSRGDSKCKTLCAAKGGQCYTLAREAHDETDINKIIDIVKEVSQCYGKELLKCYKKCKEGPNFFSKWPISLWWCVLNYWHLKSKKFENQLLRIIFFLLWKGSSYKNTPTLITYQFSFCFGFIYTLIVPITE